MRWAHQVTQKFPDGHLFVNLHGFEPAGRAASPAEAIRSLLDTLQVPPRRVPATLDAQIGLYRSLLAGRRMLILLDNARDADQVRPLLPASPGSLVLVTSRSQLTGLVATDGAHSLTLDLLPPAEAWQLLGRRIGSDRLASDPAAVNRIIDRCAGLPLALALVAARAAIHPDRGLGSVADELDQGLDAFTTGDTTTDLRAVLSWSYQALSPPARRLFRLLALHPGPDIGVPAAANLTGLPDAQVRPPLAELTRTHLVTEPAPGRYALHDLVRAYAGERAGTATEPELRAARRRMLDHYLHTAHTTARLLRPRREQIALDPPAPGAAPTQLADLAQAQAWLTAELPNLTAAVATAADTGFDGHAWRLAWSLVGALDLRGHWHDQAAVQTVAVQATIRSGDRQAQARARAHLALAHARLGEPEAARHQLRHVLALGDELGDRTCKARAHSDLGWLLTDQRQPRAALDHYQQALEQFREAGSVAGQARILNSIGWAHALLGEYQQTFTYCRQALDLMTDLDDRQGQAGAWDSIGYAHHHLGDHQQALDCYRKALTLYREVHDRYLQADTLSHIGDTHRVVGETSAARAAWQEALAILDQLGHPMADRIRAKLDDTATPHGRAAASSSRN